MKNYLPNNIRFIAGRIALGFKYQEFFPVSTVVAIFGLILGISILVVVLSVVNGFERELRNRVLSLVPHVSIYSNGSKVAEQEFLQAVKEHPDIRGYADFVQGLVLISVPGKVLGGQLLGITNQGIRDVTILENFLDSGSSLPVKPYQLLLGSKAAEELGLKIGDMVTVTLPSATITPLGFFPRLKRFQISGTFTSGTDFDRTNFVASLSDVQRLFARQPRYRGWRISLVDLFEAQRVSWELIGDSTSLYHSHWGHTHGALYQAVVMQKSIMWLLLSLVIAVAAFNVASSLGMLILKKEQDIAILVSQGASRAVIMKIFFWVACLIGFAGIIPGLLLGMGITLILGDIVIWIEYLFAINLLEQYFVRYLPVQIQTGDLLIIALVAGGLCAIASIRPARKAAKVLPHQILRNE